MHFGENQLSRSLIGLSPLPTAHPLHFQLKWVRSSTTSYRRFNLAMGRSLRFGSRSRHCNALFRLAFATASPHGLTSRRNTNSQAHSSKGTPSPLHDRSRRLRRIVSTRFQVLFHSPPGVLFTFPSRYWSAIGHQGVFRLSGWSRQIHTGFLGPRATWDTNRESSTFRLRGCHPLCRAFRMPFDYINDFLLPAGCQLRLSRPTTPITQRLTAVTRARFGLFRVRSPLLTESLLFSLPVGTEMFHFPTFPPHTLCVQVWVTGHDSCRVSPFGNPRITARLTAPRGLSQPPTSFIGSWCQGIHRAPLLTCPQIFDARVHCAVLKIRVVPVPVLVAYRGPAIDQQVEVVRRGMVPLHETARDESRAVEGPEVSGQMPV